MALWLFPIFTALFTSEEMAWHLSHLRDADETEILTHIFQPMVYITLFHARHTKANIPTSVNYKDANTRKISDLAKTEVPSHSKTNNTESSNKTQCCVWFNRERTRAIMHCVF